MNIAIIGSGGREYAIGKALREDKRIQNLYFIPGNAKSVELGENVNLSSNDEIVKYCQNKHIDLVVIGPEDPLINGLSDALQSHNIASFGPKRDAAKLEGSKAFMKDFVSKVGIKTARFLNTSDIQKAYKFIDSLQLPLVIKADGLCAGKGVVIAQSYDEAKSVAKDMLDGSSFGKSGEHIVIEEFLDGYELSVFGICDGEDCILLPAAQDHKRLLDDDKGPNTGGMGAYAPTPLCDDALLSRIKNEIFIPTLKGMKEIDAEFVGVLFAGIMVVKRDNILEPYLLEFNVRFGDPECEILLPLLDTPLLDVLLLATDKNLSKQIKIKDKYCVGVVAASKNYPYGTSPKAEIKIDSKRLESLKEKGHIIYAGVSAEDGILYASGGRVLLGVGIGASIKEAKSNAYEILECVSFEGKQYRSDISNKALNKEST